MIGDNNPPPHAAFALSVDDLFQQVSDTLEGVEIETAEQEAGAAGLLDEVRQVAKDAEKHRKAEKQPHLDAGKAVDANWKPIKDRLSAAENELKSKLTPYRVAQQKAKEEAEKKAREEAAAKVEAAQSKLKDPEALQARFDAEEELKQARKLEATANRSERAPTGLRTRKVAMVNDRKAALNWIIQNDPGVLTEFIQSYAQSNAVNRPMDGVEVIEEKRAA